MEELKLGAVEARFADIIWENEPLTSGELVGLCLEKLGWKKSTTYTVLKKLCAKGIFQNVNGTVSTVMTREEYYSRQSEQFVEDTFAGSLPAFITAFTKNRRLTEDEIEEIKKMIDTAGEV